MDKQLVFTFQDLEKQFEEVLKKGYRVLRCADYLTYKKNKETYKVWINRVDIDFSVQKAKRLLQIFESLHVKASFFIRLHAEEYNSFSFENYKTLKAIRDAGHEIGYHSEVVDEAAVWNETAEGCLRRDIEILERMLEIKIDGVASHGGNTGLNNLDFWKNKNPADFGLLYEAYDQEPAFNLFRESLYVSDGNWTSWKCYEKGVLKEGDTRNIAEHAGRNERVIYSLVHPETFKDE